MSKGPVISIVEDDAAVRAATENLVKSLGFDVYTFASAQEFLQSHTRDGDRMFDFGCADAKYERDRVAGRTWLTADFESL